MPDSRFFKKKGQWDFQAIQRLTECKIIQPLDAEFVIDGLATLNGAKSKDLSFYHNVKYREALSTTAARMILCKAEDFKNLPKGSIGLIVENPHRSYALLANEMYEDVESFSSTNSEKLCHSSAKIGKNVIIEPGAIIMSDVEIGDNTIIGAYTIIRQGVIIGNDCRIGAQCVISHSIIGNKVTLFPGAKVGQAGFGFVMDKDGYFSVPQLGRVVIHDKVEIGANTTVDRGALEDTVIGFGTRIDNLVQIGHGVQIGEHCVIVALVGISGSTKLGDRVIAAGQVGIAGHLKIGDGVFIAAKSGVNRDIVAHQVMGGIPAVPIEQWHRQTVMVAKLAQQKREYK